MQTWILGMHVAVGAAVSKTKPMLLCSICQSDKLSRVCLQAQDTETMIRPLCQPHVKCHGQKGPCSVQRWSLAVSTMSTSLSCCSCHALTHKLALDIP